MSQSSVLLVTEQYALQQWGGSLRTCFPNGWILHVGSSTLRRDYHDIDIRIVLSDDEFDALAAVCDVHTLSVSLSVWGQQVTRLPIDCQVQRNSDNQAETGNRGSIGGLPKHWGTTA